MEVVKEEKERYKVSVGSDYITICDYEENRIKALDNCGMQSLLNLQDNQIKAKEKEANTYAKEIVFLDNKIKLLERENRQLKQQLNNVDFYKNYCELKSYSDDLIKGLTEQCQQLKQQLAEKDKQIDYYQSLLKRSCDECNIKLKTIKTNFALEQLEKVKEKALHFYVNDAPELTSFYGDVKEIDNQIKQLKEKNN